MKTDDAFLKVLYRVEHGIKKMDEQATETRWLYEQGERSTAFESAMTLEKMSEQTVLLTRVLPVYSGLPFASSAVAEMVSLCIPVKIGYTAENWFCVRIPALLPKKGSGSAEYIRSFLYPAMREFFMNQTPVRYNNCVLIYRHVYDAARPERQRRDHDNIEINMVSDIVAMYVMPDDGPSICSHYYCSAAGTEDRTEVYVVPRESFPIWLVTEKAMPSEGVKLYAERL